METFILKGIWVAPTERRLTHSRDTDAPARDEIEHRDGDELVAVAHRYEAARNSQH